jgi:hypothetical protein
MEVAPVDQGYLDGRTTKPLGSVEPAETSSENDYAMGDTFKLSAVSDQLSALVCAASHRGRET